MTEAAETVLALMRVDATGIPWGRRELRRVLALPARTVRAALFELEREGDIVRRASNTWGLA